MLSQLQTMRSLVPSTMNLLGDFNFVKTFSRPRIPQSANRDRKRIQLTNQKSVKCIKQAYQRLRNHR